MDEVATRIPPASPVTKLRVRGGDTRRTSESPSGKVVPHYLQASTGSCHEFCKHGKPDEHVDSRPWRTKPVIGKLHPKEIEVAVSAAIKKTVVVKAKPSVDHKIQSPTMEITSVNKTDATGESNTTYWPETTSLEAEEVKQENSTPLENVEKISLYSKCSKQPSNKPSMRSPSPIASRSSMDGRKSIDLKKAFEERKSIDKKKTVQGKKTVDEKKSIDDSRPKCDGKADNAERDSEDNKSAYETKSLEGRKISLEKKGSEESKNSLEKKGSEESQTSLEKKGTEESQTSLEKKGSEESKTSPEKKESYKESKTSPEKKGSKESKSSNLEGNKKDGNLGKVNINGKSELLKKQVAAPKPNMKMKPPPSLNPITAKPPSPLHPSSAIRSKTNEKNQAAEKLSTAKLESKKAGTPTAVSPSSKSSADGAEVSTMKKVRLVRVVSSVRRQRIITKVVAKDTDDQGEEAVDAIKTPPEKKSPASVKNKVASSESLLPFSPSVSKATVKPRISYMPSRRKSMPAESEQKTDVKDASTQVLKKSNAVDKESENIRSTTLKARRVPLIGETAQINRRSLKKRIGTGAGGTAIEKNSSDSYLLRRPSARRKKNVQVLFNKVIEETASRLVRTSKSKVLALVGAFETVISIQRKSSVETTPKARKISSSTAIKAG